MVQTPTFRELSPEECVDVLRRNTYGRIAFTLHGRVDVEPVHYVFDHNWLYIRTSKGTKVASLHHGPWVAFEVDEVRGPFDWTSVVVKGTVYFVSGVAHTDDPAAAAQAADVIRRLMPDAMTPNDPVPSRNVLLRISVNETYGRASRP